MHTHTQLIYNLVYNIYNEDINHNTGGEVKVMKVMEVIYSVIPDTALQSATPVITAACLPAS